MNNADRIAPIHFIFGAETLLVEEHLDRLRAKMVKAGYAERVRYTLETGFNWNQLFESSQTASVFADKRLIELRMPGKPGAEGEKALIKYADLPAAARGDTLLIIIGGAIDKRGKNTKWFKALSAAGAINECATVGAQQLPGWIAARMRAANLAFDDDAVAHLSHFVEGNLLAAAQEINLLALLHPNANITADMMQGVISDHARFTAFGFVDACLAGRAARGIRILQSLRREQTEAVLVLWALAREVRTLSLLAAAGARGDNPQALFRRHGVWPSRAALIKSALSRLRAAHCQRILRDLARADLMLKGRAPMLRRDIWEEIERIALLVCGVKAV